MIVLVTGAGVGPVWRDRCVGHPRKCRDASSACIIQVLHVIRHGATEMAAYMALHKYGSPHQVGLQWGMAGQGRVAQQHVCV